MKALHLLVQRGGRLRTAISRPIKRGLGVRSLGVLQFVKRRNIAPAPPPRVAASLLEEMAEVLAPDVALASGLLGRDLAAEFGWPATSRRRASAGR